MTVQRPGGLCIAELGLLRLTLHASRGSSGVPHPHPVLGALNVHLVKNGCEGSPRLKSGEDHHANRPGTGLAAPPRVAGGCTVAVAHGDRLSTLQMLCGLLA